MSKRRSRAGRREPPRRPTTSRAVMPRRVWIGAAIGGAVLFVGGQWAWRLEPRREAVAEVTVFKSPTCGCCGKWIARMREHGFTVVQRNMTDVSPIKREARVPRELYSCHTSTVGGYTIEGHVPPDLVEQALRERPNIAGLAVPGMPRSAPGMEVGHERYEVLSFRRDGSTTVFAVR